MEKENGVGEVCFLKTNSPWSFCLHWKLWQFLAWRSWNHLSLLCILCGGKKLQLWHAACCFLYNHEKKIPLKNHKTVHKPDHNYKCGIVGFLCSLIFITPLTVRCFFFLFAFKELPSPKNSFKCSEKLRLKKLTIGWQRSQYRTIFWKLDTR